MSKQSVEVPLNDLRALFDIAVESMDFGSGFLDDDEVAVLRRIAVVIGVDPMVGTPGGYRKKFVHAINPVERKVYPPVDFRKPFDPFGHRTQMDDAPTKTVCSYCGEEPDALCHQTQGEGR